MTEISVPKGGGALAGIGETFQPDLHTGTVQFGVPIPLPPGRAELTPHLSLSYHSASGNGPFGMGWSLDTPQIARRTDRGVPVYDDDVDVFVLSGAEELVPVPIGNATPADLPAGASVTRYRPRTESGFARIVHVHSQTDDYWDVWSRDGLRSRYGTARPAAAAADWTDPAAVRTPEGRVFRWSLTSTTNSFGSAIVYGWTGDDTGSAQRYLSWLSYADYGELDNPAYAVRLDVTYQTRPDPFRSFVGGFELRTTLRATSLAVSTVGSAGQPVTRVNLRYADQTGTAPASGLSLLTSVRITGLAADGSTQALPPITLQYRDFDPTARRFRAVPDLPPGPLGAATEFVDVFGDGLSSLLTLDAEPRYQRGRGDCAFGQVQRLAATPGVRLGSPGVALDDVDGDGRPELVASGAGTGAVWHLTDDAVAGFDIRPTRLTSVPPVDYGDRQLRRIDLDGDHISDLLVGGSPAYEASADGTGNFSRLRPLTGAPAPTADLADPRVQVADMTGDGLSDLVLVHDGALTYWPNMGHGHFGSAIAMTGAPRFADAALYPGSGFDPRRLILADVTGDGAADVLYVGNGWVTLWLNRCGNGFADPTTIRGTPQVSNQSTVQALDLLGIGVAGLLWAGLGITGTAAFLDLTGGVKPYLLTGIDNHRGAITELTWSTSTAHAIADREAGSPWSTTLPFPVHVVDRTTVKDVFSATQLSSGYRYHDGYWDSTDREFRGFGRVEQIDTLEPMAVQVPQPARIAALDVLTQRAPLPAGLDVAAAGNLLTNWSFDNPGAQTSTTLTTLGTGSGQSAAAGWGTWNNYPTTTTTELLPSDLPTGSGGQMLHVITGAPSCGIVQTFLAQDAGPPRTVASAWIRLVRGAVAIGTGNGGHTEPDVRLDQPGGWTLIEAGNGVSPANEFIVYSDAPDTEFYVDHAWVRPAAVPAAPVGSPPVRTVHWFHLGPIGPAHGNWTERDPSAQYWTADPPLRPYLDDSGLPAGLNRFALRECLRGLRGRVLRTETYCDDGDPAYGGLPYEVRDNAFEVAAVLDGRSATDTSWLTAPVVTVHELLSRTSTWLRGNEPLVHLTVSGNYDEYGRAGAVVDAGVPRGRDPRGAGMPCLATVTRTSYATRDDGLGYRLDRVASSARHEALDPGTSSVWDFAVAALAGTHDGTLRALEFAYYDGNAETGLALGTLGDHGLPVRSEHLVLTPDLLATLSAAGASAIEAPYLSAIGAAVTDATWTSDYPAAFRSWVQDAVAERGPHLGYVWHDAAPPYVAGYYAQTARSTYDVHTPVAGRPPRGMLLRALSPTGGATTTAWDSYDLLPAQITDPAGLLTSATYDYRLLHPSTVTDPNGNVSAVAYTPLGLTASVARLGKPGGTDGDTITEPSQLFSYDLLAYDESIAVGVTPAPMSVTSVRRVDHRWTLVNAENARRAAAHQPPLTEAEIAAMFGPDERTAHPERFIVGVDFTDGLGRSLQTRTQADDVAVLDLGLPADATAATAVTTGSTTTRVVVSGAKRYDNKGRPVQTWEPYFDNGYGYVQPGLNQLASLAVVTQHYDPLGRPTQSVAPDGSLTSTVYGVVTDLATPETAAPSPWETFTYDADDNAARTHPSESLDVTNQWNTPSSTEIDALGRTVRAVRRGLVTDVVTTTTYDIDGHQTSVTDPLNRVCARTTYDLVGTPLTQWLLDAGQTRSVHDPAGAVVEARDERGAFALHAYDAAHRPATMWAADRSGDVATLREVTVYGDDSAASGLSLADAQRLNACGKPIVNYDEAGQARVAGYDLDGNANSTTRRTLQAALLVRGIPSNGAWANTSYVADWQPPAGTTLDAHAATLLDATAYTADASFDALGRRTRTTAPTDSTGARAVLVYTYGRGGGIDSVTVDGVAALSQVVYDAHGRRALAYLGNTVLMRYLYDPSTMRLRRLHAQRAVSGAAGWTTTGTALQDCTYRHDVGGNLLTVGDRTPACGLPVGADPVRSTGVDSLNRVFSYDALDRLVGATGRETDAVPNPPWLDMPRATDPTLARAYAEAYVYDAVGNLTSLGHATNVQGTGAYTRTFAGTEGTNRLASLTVGSNLVASYAYDAAGNLLSEASNRIFEWDHAGRMTTFRNQVGTATPSVYAQYRYDATGQRIMKLVRRSSGPDEVTIYVGGFERTLVGPVGGSQTAYDELHVSDHDSRLALFRRGAAHPDDALREQRTLFQLSDPLMSVVATLDDAGTVLNREEYLPYGETSFGSYGRKRYRYTGRERDNESGLAYHHARYYAPYLARWTSCDPLPKIGDTPYRYAASDPLMLVDPGGAAEHESHSSNSPAEPRLNLVRGPYNKVGGHHTTPQAAHIDPVTGHDTTGRQVTTTVVGQGDFTKAAHDRVSAFQNRLGARLHGRESGKHTVGGVTIDVSKEGKATPSPWLTDQFGYFGWKVAGAGGNQARGFTQQEADERSKIAGTRGASPLPTRVPGANVNSHPPQNLARVVQTTIPTVPLPTPIQSPVIPTNTGNHSPIEIDHSSLIRPIESLPLPNSTAHTGPIPVVDTSIVASRSPASHGVVAGLAVGVVLWEVAKWVVAAIAAPESLGGSLAAAAALP